MELIKIDTDHFVVVDDSEIKEGDFIYGIINGSFEYKKHSSISGYLPKLYSTDKKITHSTQPIETFNWMGNSEKGYDTIKPLSLQEVKELIGEVDVKKKADIDSKNHYVNQSDYWAVGIDSYKRGYNQALEDNKAKRYTEEDLKYMFDCGRNYQNNAEITFKASFEYLLQTKTSWQVEFIDGKLKLKGV